MGRTEDWRQNANTIRYADDTVMIADIKEKLQKLVDTLMEECRGMGLRSTKEKRKSLREAKDIR